MPRRCIRAGDDRGPGKICSKRSAWGRLAATGAAEINMTAFSHGLDPLTKHFCLGVAPLILVEQCKIGQRKADDLVMKTKRFLPDRKSPLEPLFGLQKVTLSAVNPCQIFDGSRGDRVRGTIFCLGCCERVPGQLYRLRIFSGAIKLINLPIELGDLVLARLPDRRYWGAEMRESSVGAS